MQEQKQIIEGERGNLLNIINLALYCETCPECKMPARGETFYSDQIGVESWFFCINPRCINFDASCLRKKREELEAAVKESKGWRRWRNRLWKAAQATQNREQKRLRELYRD